MSIGRINTPIDLIIVEKIKDKEGFTTDSLNSLAQVRAYREDQNASKRWANRAIFPDATTLFRFRRIPKVLITTEMLVICHDEYFEIISVENIRNRNMYIEVLAKKVVIPNGESNNEDA